MYLSDRMNDCGTDIVQHRSAGGERSSDFGYIPSVRNIRLEL
jgi:hypothetical protein